MDDELRRLFHAVADLSPKERETYFREQQVPAEIQEELNSLLEFDSDSGHLLTEPIVHCAEMLLEEAAENNLNLRCGPYRLVRLLGRGGMGAVYLAERADGEVEQRVAVKLLAISLKDAFRQRFLRERQILATLNHPAIARLLDAGHTEDGRPYLAMEYVDGVPIDQYGEQLDQRRKLELFIEVCGAVAYAHRNLIVHCDLKPSNILVDRDERPRLLDFGTAKIVDPVQNLERTATLLQALTPQYASPEQVRGEAITTATDVYSLGLVLYKLLTGRLPYSFPSVTPTAISRTICEVEPEPPHLGGDLDNILLMALRKEPERRYVSVSCFADDIGRVLSHRPILARPDTLRYRTAKFMRRNRLILSAATVSLAAVIFALAVTAHQERISQKRFEQVRKLAHTFVFDFHDEIAKLEGSTKAREMMVRTGLEYLDSLSQNAGSDLDLQREIAAAYMKIGDAQGYPTKPNLGRIEDALASYRKAGDIYRRIAARDRAYLPDLANYYLRFAGLIRFTRNLEQARELSELAVQTFHQLSTQTLSSDDLAFHYIEAWCTLGDTDEDLNHFHQAWYDFSRCYELAKAALRRRNGSGSATGTKTGTNLRFLSAFSQAAERVGTGAQNLGRLEEALRALDEDEAALRQLISAEPWNPSLHRRQALVHHYRSMIYDDDLYPNLGDPARALDSAKRYLMAAEAMHKSDPNNTSAQLSLAIALYRFSFPLREFDAKEAVTTARNSVQMFDRMIALGERNYLIESRRVRAWQRLAEAQLKAGRIAQAQRTAELALAKEQSLAVSYATEGEEQLVEVRLLIVAGNANDAAHHFLRAENLLREACARAGQIARRGELPEVLSLAHAEEALGSYYAGHRRNPEARACYVRLAELWRRFPETNDYVNRQRVAAERLLASLPAVS